ncbi:unnamed protein product [Boreogadus saida]
MNRDMEEKGILLRVLSCRTVAELPAPELPDCRRAPPAGPVSFGGSSAPGVHPPEQPESFGGRSAPGVHRRSCWTAGGARTASTAVAVNHVIVQERQRDDTGDVALGMLAGAATGLAIGSLFSVF